MVEGAEGKSLLRRHCLWLSWSPRAFARIFHRLRLILQAFSAHTDVDKLIWIIFTCLTFRRFILLSYEFIEQPVLIHHRSEDHQDTEELQGGWNFTEQWPGDDN